MTIDVHLFAGARDRVSKSSVRVEVMEGCTVGQLRRRLTEDFPLLADIVPRAMIAVNADYASDGMSIRQGSEVALIPPVSGG